MRVNESVRNFSNISLSEWAETPRKVLEMPTRSFKLEPSPESQGHDYERILAVVN